MNDSRARLTIGLLALAPLGSGCNSEEVPKAWSALATCLAGDAAASPLAQRAEKLRLNQLGSSGPNTGKDAWPARCSAPANTLYATLDKTGPTAGLRSKMRERLNCNEEKATCAVPVDSSLISTATELWQAAESAGLKAQVSADAPKPVAAPPPTLDAKGWKSFSEKPGRLSGPLLTSDGRALVLLKSGEGRVKPTACEFAAGFAKVRCLEANADVPELPIQSLDLVNDSSGIYVAGLTDDGLVAYNLESGEKSQVRGRSGQLVRDGVVVEKGAKEEAPTAPPARGSKAKPNVKEEGFVGLELSKGKAGKEIKLPITNAVGEPISVGNQIIFVSQGEGSSKLVAKSLEHGRLKDQAALKGTYSGSLRACRTGDHFAVAAWGLRAGQQGAKAGPGGKTQFSLALYQSKAWSESFEATLAFERALDSGLVCTKTGASVVWAQSVDGSAQIGRIDCSGTGCKTNEVKLDGVDSKWWWAVGPIDDKVFVLWRSSLGETRLRVAPLAELAQAKDTILFDSPDFGGPPAGDLSTAFSGSAALLLFKGEQPVALRLGSEGQAAIVTR